MDRAVDRGSETSSVLGISLEAHGTVRAGFSGGLGVLPLLPPPPMPGEPGNPTLTSLVIREKKQEVGELWRKRPPFGVLSYEPLTAGKPSAPSKPRLVTDLNSTRLPGSRGGN